jgi:SAM-dependent methyltransferase
MTDTSPFDAAAPYYDRFRAPYPSEALDFIRASFDLDDSSRVLDLGCGPGTLAIPLSRTVAEVFAVDPDAGMLAEATRLGEQHARRNIRWMRLRAEDISPELGMFRAATLGQSFHWMDRDAVLRRLAELIEDGGGLALINPGKRRPQESWEPIAGAIVVKYLGLRPRQANPELGHEPSLRRSAHFSDFTTREFASEIVRDADSILGYLYSTSGAAKPLFGDRAASFEQDLRAALTAVNPDGVFRERLETEVMICRKRPV